MIRLQKHGLKKNFNLINLIKSGVGNIGSISRVLDDLEVEYNLVENLSQIDKNYKIILPGIGSFDSFICSLKKNNLFNIILELVNENKTPILGICVGMQSFFKESDEGFEKGFNFFDTKCTKFSEKKNKVPHLGWNKVFFQSNCALFKNILDNYFYFAHSYHINFYNKSNVIGSTIYGEKFVSAIQKNHIYGVQFHPEKSYEQGKQLIKNFINEC